MSTRREINPGELEAIWKLSAIYPDLRTLEPELIELRKRVHEGVQPALTPEIKAELKELERLRGVVARHKTVLAGLAQSQEELRTALKRLSAQPRVSPSLWERLIGG